MFTTLPEVSQDPVFAVNEAFARDSRADKINLGIGVYRDEAGDTPVFDAVKAAEQALVHEQPTKDYVGVAGDARFLAGVRQLLFPPSVLAENSVMLQTLGGTGALYDAMALIKKASPDTVVWCPKATWGNHHAVAAQCGLKTSVYTYHKSQPTSADEILSSLDGAKRGDVFLLHASCHNPTGIDLAGDDRVRVLEAVERLGLFLLIDAAYLGFARSLPDEVKELASLFDRVSEWAVAVSFSKNFGLYRERIGCLCVKPDHTDTVAKVAGSIKNIARSVYSMPADHGAAVVARILHDADLARSWETQLTAVRQRINDNRRAFCTQIADRTPEADWTYMRDGHGMFTMLPLSAQAISELASVEGIYVLPSGRVNLAALNDAQIPRVAAAVAQHLS